MVSQEYVIALDRYGENFVRRAKVRTRKLQRRRRTMIDQNVKKDRPRAAISTNDIELLKKALSSYIRQCEHYCVAEEEMSEMLLLYHRLGRLE